MRKIHAICIRIRLGAHCSGKHYAEKPRPNHTHTDAHTIVTALHGLKCIAFRVTAAAATDAHKHSQAQPHASKLQITFIEHSFGFTVASGASPKPVLPPHIRTCTSHTHTHRTFAWIRTSLCRSANTADVDDDDNNDDAATGSPQL